VETPRTTSRGKYFDFFQGKKEKPTVGHFRPEIPAPPFEKKGRGENVSLYCDYGENPQKKLRRKASEEKGKSSWVTLKRGCPSEVGGGDHNDYRGRIRCEKKDGGEKKN